MKYLDKLLWLWRGLEGRGEAENCVNNKTFLINSIFRIKAAQNFIFDRGFPASPENKRWKGENSKERMHAKNAKTRMSKTKTRSGALDFQESHRGSLGCLNKGIPLGWLHGVQSLSVLDIWVGWGTTIGLGWVMHNLFYSQLVSICTFDTSIIYIL